MPSNSLRWSALMLGGNGKPLIVRPVRTRVEITYFSSIREAWSRSCAPSRLGGGCGSFGLLCLNTMIGFTRSSNLVTHSASPKRRPTLPTFQDSPRLHLSMPPLMHLSRVMPSAVFSSLYLSYISFVSSSLICNSPEYALILSPKSSYFSKYLGAWIEAGVSH